MLDEMSKIDNTVMVMTLLLCLFEQRELQSRIFMETSFSFVSDFVFKRDR